MKSKKEKSILTLQQRQYSYWDNLESNYNLSQLLMSYLEINIIECK